MTAAVSATVSSASALQQRLQKAIAPLALDIADDSHLHRHHAEGGSGAHLRLRIVAAQFEGMPALARHRLIYQTAGDLAQLGIHALAITALAPAEA